MLQELDIVVIELPNIFFPTGDPVRDAVSGDSAVFDRAEEPASPLRALSSGPSLMASICLAASTPLWGRPSLDMRSACQPEAGPLGTTYPPNGR